MVRPRHEIKRSRATFKVEGLSLSIEQAFVLLALDDLKGARHVDLDWVTAIWRRYMAANLTGREWLTRAFRKADARRRCVTRFNELVINQLAWIDFNHPRCTPKAALLIEQLRQRFSPAMQAEEFRTYCTNSYDSVKSVA